MRSVSEFVSYEAYAGVGTGPKGNLVDSWAAAVSVGVYAFDPGTTGESASAGHVTRVVTSPSLLVPTSVYWSPRDRVTVRGLLYEVDGETLEYRNPHDPSHDGNRVNLKRVEG